MLQRLTGPPCVWMRAGVIRYWLCNRAFECESCPLDAALRGPRTASPRDGAVPERLEPVPARRLVGSER